MAVQNWVGDVWEEEMNSFLCSEMGMEDNTDVKHKQAPLQEYWLLIVKIVGEGWAFHLAAAVLCPRSIVHL